MPGFLDKYAPSLDLNFIYLCSFSLSFADVVILRWAYKRAREIARRAKYFRGELALGHPKYPEGSAAAIGRDTSPVPIDAPNIQYTEEDNNAIDEYHRQTGQLIL